MPLPALPGSMLLTIPKVGKVFEISKCRFKLNPSLAHPVGGIAKGSREEKTQFGIRLHAPDAKGAAAEKAAVKAGRNRRTGRKSIKYDPTSQIKSPVKLPAAKTQVWQPDYRGNVE